MHRLHILTLAVAFLLASCDDDTTAPPDPGVPLSDLEPSLVIEPASGPIGTFFEVSVEFGQAAPDNLAEYELYVGWPTRRASVRIPADETGRMQVDRVGTYELSASVRAPEGSDELNVDLPATLTVTGGSGDGSLDMIQIPAGSFLQGNTERRAFGGYSPQRTVQLSGYFIGRTEVTNAAFVETLEWAVAEGRAEIFGNMIVSDEGIIRILVADLDNTDFAGFEDPEPTFVIEPGHELHPAGGISWMGAALWCNWQSERDGLEPAYTHTTIDLPINDIAYLECDFTKNGYRLPTQAEWEKAARGGEMLPSGPNPMPGRWYPWGDNDYRELLSGEYGFHANVFGHLGEHSTPVGSFPYARSPYGLDDTIGNVMEWVHDWFDYDYYETSPPAQDPRGPETFGLAEEYLAKTWCSSPSFDWVMWVETGCSARQGARFNYDSASMGFRVARSY
jgi:iron(II)-dependent oxidoreductase